MAEENGSTNETNINDIIKQQSTTIDTLVDNLGKTNKGTTEQQPIYMTSPDGTKQAPNYILYILIALGVYFFILRGK